MQRLVGQILDFSKIQNSKMKLRSSVCGYYQFHERNNQLFYNFISRAAY